MFVSYLKIVRQMSSLVTPGRSVARTSAWVEKGKVSTSYVHNSGSDESHAACTEHRACWGAPVHGVLCRDCSGAQWLQWGPMLWPPWLGQEGLPGLWPCPGSQAVGCQEWEAEMFSGTWRTGKVCQHPHPILSWLDSLDSSFPFVHLEN